MENENLYTMKQPDLGKKISELRKKKGLTQEELVEQCNINVRTIQRIEAGEVTPRSYTLKTILQVLGMEMSDVVSDNSYLTLWSVKDRRTLNNSWIAAIFVTVLTVLGLTVELFVFVNKSKGVGLVVYRIFFSVLLFISIYIYLKGYLTISNKHKISFLKNAVILYLVMDVVISLILLPLDFFEYEKNISVVLGVISVILLGISELFMGIGFLKIKDYFGSFSQIVGILKIINASMLLTFILSPTALFLVVPILVLEVVFMYNIYQKSRVDNHS